MQEVTVISSGTSSNGLNWSLVRANISGFILTGFVHPEQPIALGDTKIPSAVYANIEWKA